MITKKNYDKKNDILAMNWGGAVKHSIELFEGNLVLDINNKDEIVGMEIMDFNKQIKKHNKKMDKLFKLK